MCPLRFILVFLSAILAGYFAWKTVQSSPEDEKIDSNDLGKKNISTKDKREFSLIKVLIIYDFIVFSPYFLWTFYLLVVGGSKIFSKGEPRLYNVFFSLGSINHSTFFSKNV